MTEIARPEPVDQEHDLGNGVVAVWCRNSDGDVVGLIERHHCPPLEQDRPSGGAVMFVLGYGPEQTWTIESGTPGEWEGLTLSPSILCKTCGNHGFIQDGKWVQA